MSAHDTLNITSAPGLLTASRRLLRPLVRLLMRSGVTFPVLTEVLRGLFVDVAVSEILIEPKARSDSRVSLLTGIHRKDIRRFRESPAEITATPDAISIGSQIIAVWSASAPFIDQNGKPRPLPKVGEAGKAEASFDSLVASVTTDIRSRAVLDDWLSRGIVHIDQADRVQLNVQAFIPRPGGQEQLFYFGRNLHDHVAAAAANVAATAPAPFLDRSVHYDGLTAAQAAELEAFARDAAMQALLAVNRRALEILEAGESAANPGCPAPRRVNFGVFVFADDEAPVVESQAGEGSAA